MFGLTPRERQVLALLAEGATNRQIGNALYMAEKNGQRARRFQDSLEARRAHQDAGGRGGAPPAPRLAKGSAHALGLAARSASCLA